MLSKVNDVDDPTCRIRCCGFEPEFVDDKDLFHGGPHRCDLNIMKHYYFVTSA